MSEVRRFDELERVVRDSRAAAEDGISTVLSRLGTHTHQGNRDVVGESRYMMLSADDAATTTVEPVGASGVDEFSFAVSAFGRYAIECFLRVGMSAASDMLLSWTVPTGADVMWAPWGPIAAATSYEAQINTAALNAATSGSVGGNDAGFDGTTQTAGTLIIGSTAGTATLNFRANVSAATIKAYSWIRCTRLA
jgi:hypothetical protein